MNIATNDRPTIKGIFVNSHINALRHERGEEGIEELKHRYGKSIDFNNTDNVPVREEVEILEQIVRIASATELTAEKCELEAGRLHFRNFTTTPLWRVLAPIFARNQKFLLMHTRHIAEHVFRGVLFSSEDVGPQGVKIVMMNNDYPVEHFQGFFEEWLSYSGVIGTVEATSHSSETYEYLITWR